MLDPRGADVARHGHVVVPRESTWTDVGAYVVRGINRAKLIRPTSIVGPGEKDGVCTRPSG